MNEKEMLLKFLELQSESVSLLLKEALKINGPVALRADIKTLAFGEADQLSFRSTELAEKLEALFSAVGDFSGAVSRIFPDKYKPVTKLEMFVLSLYTMKMLEFFKFFFQAEVLRLKFQCQQLDVNNFTDDLFKISGIEFFPEFLDQSESAVDFREKSHESSRECDSCNPKACCECGEGQRKTEGK